MMNLIPQKLSGLLIACLILFTLPLPEAKAKSLEETRFSDSSHAKYAVIISIDGFRPDFYLDKSWPAPMLQYMSEEGAHAIGMNGVFPSVTYPSHTTMVTGSFVGNHGILFNSRAEDRSFYFEYDAIQTLTIWSAAKESGMITANVGWPVTLHAPIDFNIPISGALQNSGLHEDPIRAFTTPEGFFEELEREATGRIRPGDLSNANRAKEAKVADMAAWIVKNHQPNLLTVALQHTDSMQHRYGREHTNVRLAVSAADHAIARIVQAYDDAGILDETVFFIGGDHGFTNVNVAVAPNVWLTNAGIQTDMQSDDWQASFVTSGGSAFLYLNDDTDTLLLERITTIIEELDPSVKDTFYYISRDKLDKLQANPQAHLALSGKPNVAFSGAAQGDVLRRPGNRATHGHLSNFDDMKIGFVAWGAGVREGTIIPELNLVDFAPTLARIMGIEMPENDGIVIHGLINQ